MEATPQPSAPRSPAYKIIVTGASGSGKTCFINRLRLGGFAKEHRPTMGAEVHPLTLHTTHGPITFKVWDLAGDPRFAGLGEGYYEGADGLLVFYDLTAPATLHRAVGLLDTRPKGIAAVLCGSKVDLADTGAPAGKPYPGVPYYEVSARTCYNVEKPFLSLARQLTGDPNLEFVEAPALVPLEVHVDPALLAAWAGDPADFSAHDREFAYSSLSACFNEYGEPLRDDLEDLVCEADRAGYDSTVRVVISFQKRP